MNSPIICVLGGSGFVGRQVCAALAARGLRLRVPVRSRDRAKHLTMLPTCETIAADVHDPVVLKMLIAGCEAVVNLVGVLHDGRGNGSFEAAHTGLARKVIEACRATGVRRVLHMSALGAAVDAASGYQRSKGTAEKLMRDSGLDVTIFRPSVIFGREDQFLNLFARLLKTAPALIVPMGEARVQPVAVSDVAHAFAEAYARREAIGQTYDLVGPRVWTMRELGQFVADSMGSGKPVFGADVTLSNIMAFTMECLPGKLMSVDNVRSMSVANVSNAPFPFGITPQSVEALAPQYVAGGSPRGRYAEYRDRTRRAA
jgi:NADH dehydrogenase